MQQEENRQNVSVGFCYKKLLYTHAQRSTEEPLQVGKSEHDLTQLFPGPSQERDQPRKGSPPQTQRSKEAQWQVGEPKLRTQRNGALTPAPPRAAQGPGVTPIMVSQKERLSGSPYRLKGVAA